ncbi:unnamed protein product [Lasius platythorax]|uniref:Uncharacterized protein n=1 Tax=Lasius platythorax TaxID=488582 RepID=A0AAV2NWL9_9HYME
MIISVKIVSAFPKQGPSIELSLNYLKQANYRSNDIVSCLVALSTVNSMICQRNGVKNTQEDHPRYIERAQNPGDSGLLHSMAKVISQDRRFVKQRRKARY